MNDMPHRLLIVDDEEAIAFAISRFFAGRGFEVDSASELEEAEAKLLTSAFDVLIIDLRLTGVHASEGLDLLRFAREHVPQAKAILLSAFISAEVAAAGKARGAAAVVKKPAALSELYELVMTLIETPQ
jgi:DNA-binding response OmpR family regulator